MRCAATASSTDIGENTPMKKRFIQLTAILMLVCLLLTGCGETNEPEATPEPVEVTPTPVPTEAPVVTVPIEDYEYYVITNSNVAVMFKYPSHWINTPGTNTIAYTEPVNSGEYATRLAVTSKYNAERQNNAALLESLELFLDMVKEKYLYYEPGEQKNDVNILNTTGVRQKYTAVDPTSGKQITGYVLVCYSLAAKRTYLFHFTADSERYDELSVIIDVVRESMTVTK